VQPVRAFPEDGTQAHPVVVIFGAPGKRRHIADADFQPRL
jgi:hypothetical protein